MIQTNVRVFDQSPLRYSGLHWLITNFHTQSWHDTDCGDFDLPPLCYIGIRRFHSQNLVWYYRLCGDVAILEDKYTGRT